MLKYSRVYSLRYFTFQNSWDYARFSKNWFQPRQHVRYRLHWNKQEGEVWNRGKIRNTFIKKKRGITQCAPLTFNEMQIRCRMFQQSRTLTKNTRILNSLSTMARNHACCSSVRMLKRKSLRSCSRRREICWLVIQIFLDSSAGYST